MSSTVKCPKCENKASTRKLACPKCGEFLNADETSKSFKVILPCNVDKKLNAIKATRELTGWGLAQAKDVVESSNPIIMENVDLDTAKKATNWFQKADVDSMIVSSDGRTLMVKRLPRCPICSSHSLITGQRKRSIWELLLKKKGIINTCQSCGYKFDSQN